MTKLSHQPNEKLCTTCKVWKPFDSFRKNIRHRDGKNYTCKSCEKKFRDSRADELISRRRKWYLEKRSVHRIKLRARHLLAKIFLKERIFFHNNYFSNVFRRKYEITMEGYLALLSSQEGRCKLCNSVPKKRRLQVDHCHKTLKVRGLICNRCNSALGFVNDDIQLLQKMICYIQDNQ